MNVFGSYARYYDLLNRDKDYGLEAEYVDGLIQARAPGAKTILNLGCGTGKHDFFLAEKGYEMTSVDLSEEMLAVAKARLSTSNLQPPLPHFQRGDIRSVRFNKTFDVIVSLFHVMSYQRTNEDLSAAFDTARAHLRPGGKFIFDFWYGPAVLTERPSIRIKRMEDEEIEVTRIAEPVLHAERNLVEVNYQVMVIEKATRRVEKIRETHHMRYLFIPEIIGYLSAHGMELVHAAEWMTQKIPDTGTWSVCCTATVAD